MRALPPGLSPGLVVPQLAIDVQAGPVLQGLEAFAFAPGHMAIGPSLRLETSNLRLLAHQAPGLVRRQAARLGAVADAVHLAVLAQIDTGVSAHFVAVGRRAVPVVPVSVVGGCGAGPAGDARGGKQGAKGKTMQSVHDDSCSVR